MPSDDDDSSLQFQKLLSTPTPPVTSPGVGTNSEPSHPPNLEQRYSTSVDVPLGPKNSSYSTNVDDVTFSSGPDKTPSSSPKGRFQPYQSSSPPNNPDICYSWLLHGRDAKHSEGTLSTASTTSSSSSSESSSFTSLPLPPPPDGGWGWMVVLGAFVILFICDGLAYCFGVMYHELLIQFGESRSKTSLVGSIFFGVSMILGPLAGAMTTKFGCRKMTIVGGLMSFAGFMLSYFANSVDMLCFTFSVVVGTGFSFCYVTSAVVVHFYFDKRRSLATGLAVCGTGVGTFVFAPLMEYLIAEYGLRGMFLIMAAVSLNLVVSGMLFISLKFTEAERWQYYFAEFDKLPHGRENLELGRMRNMSESTDFSTEVDVFDEESRTMSMLSLPTFISNENKPSDPSSQILKEALKNSKNPHLTFMRYMKNAYLQSSKKTENKYVNRRPDQPTVTISITPNSPCTSDVNTLSEDMTQSASLIPQKKKPNSSQHLNVTLKPNNTDTKLPSNSNLKKCTDGVGKTPSFLDIANDLKSRSLTRVVSSGVHMGKHNVMGMQLLLYRNDIFYRRLSNQPFLENKPCVLGTSCPELVGSLEEENRGRFHQMLKDFQSGASDIVHSMIDLSLFRNTFFTVFVISNFLFFFWNDIPYMFSADHSVEHGVSTEKASLLISIIGITSAIGQLVFGFIGDTKVNLINVYALAMILSGVLTGIVPWMATYWSMASALALFGFFVSVSFPFCSVLLVSYLGVDQLTNAYGLLMLMQGIANTLGPPFAGWISDETHSYDYAFYLSGLFFAISGLLMYIVLLPWCRVHKIKTADSQDNKNAHAHISSTSDDFDDGDVKEDV